MLTIKYLDSLWSKAVKAKAHNHCQWCGKSESLEAHHIVHRRQNAILRHSLVNGMCLCHACHSVADTLTGRRKAYELADVEEIERIEKNYKFKSDYLIKFNLSEKEYREELSRQLRGIIKENNKICVR